MERIRDLYDNITGIRPQGQTSPRLREEDRSLDEGDDTYDDR